MTYERLLCNKHLDRGYLRNLVRTGDIYSECVPMHDLATARKVLPHVSILM